LQAPPPHHWVSLVEFLAELIGNHFEASAGLVGVEEDGLFSAHGPVAFVPPWGIGIVPDFDDALVQQ
jgi:hypothetical protein